MSSHYNPHEIEAKWQSIWPQKRRSFEIPPGGEPYYVLDMISYPSNEGLHMGHWRPYTIADVWARYQTMLGKHVLSPVGFDAFGLPAENAAIKNGTHPAEYTKQTIATFTRQISEMGKMYDWSTRLSTASPDYYRWTQWLFIQLYQAGLAYRKMATVNWCPVDNTVLANEQVINGRCERCESEVIKKELTQWFLKITDFADELLDFSGLNWPQKVKTLQTNWIGKSQGALIPFTEVSTGKIIEVYTTRPDTLFGATYLVLAPEHDLVESIISDNNRSEISGYIEAAKQKTDIERQAIEKSKTGLFTGSFATNPINNQPIPIWIADYVLNNYGTGAIMAVPAHDERDYQFAQQYGLQVKMVIEASNLPYIGHGKLVNSGQFTGRRSHDSMGEIVEVCGGRQKTFYRLRDWLVSRQRYWGVPIPIIYCRDCGEQAVPLEKLPVVLPENVEFSLDGGSPLERHQQFRSTSCPKCGGVAERETDTLDTFVDSSWYFLRFTDPDNTQLPFTKEQIAQWLPVDFYVGGTEHSILHLLYARFIMKALYRLDFVPYTEPFQTFFGNGMIYLHGSKMSKSKGNIVNPDEMVRRYGTDALRGYILFMGPADQDVEWQENGIVGVVRFLHSVWDICAKVTEGDVINPVIVQTNHAIHKYLDNKNFNRCISELMICVNELKRSGLNRVSAQHFIQLLAPFFPHLAEELWQSQGNNTSVFESPLAIMAVEGRDMIDLPVQCNNKYRGTVRLGTGLTETDVVTAVKNDHQLGPYLNNCHIQKIIYVPGRTINFVVK